MFFQGYNPQIWLTGFKSNSGSKLGREQMKAFGFQETISGLSHLQTQRQQN